MAKRKKQSSGEKPKNGSTKSAKSAPTRSTASATAKAAKTREQIAAEKMTLAMWGLLSKGGEAFGGKLKPRINGPERAMLEREKLVQVSKVNRAYWFVVTEEGWDWAEQHLADPLPDNAGVLQDWLCRLKGFLSARDVRLYELFLNSPTGQSPTETPVQDDLEDVRNRIRTAYLSLAGGINRRVLLRNLRPALADIDRGLVDTALMQMVRNEEASLMQLDYRPDVTDEDRDAALQVGKEPRHVIWILR
ncbi:hypothetical protein [Bradyrhizobium sp.]|uniref:hypothetical protein n=1 Tax=Bradyrhizobium sp. TaxID=376 RepID=UPI004037CEAB